MMKLSDYNNRLSVLESMSDEEIADIQDNDPETYNNILNFLEINPSDLEDDYPDSQPQQEEAQLVSTNQSQQAPVEPRNIYEGLPDGVEDDSMFANVLNSLPEEERRKEIDKYYERFGSNTPEHKAVVAAREEEGKKWDEQGRQGFKLLGGMLEVTPLGEGLIDEINTLGSAINEGYSGTAVSFVNIINKIGEFAGAEKPLIKEDNIAQKWYEKNKKILEQQTGSELTKGVGRFMGQAGAVGTLPWGGKVLDPIFRSSAGRSLGGKILGEPLKAGLAGAGLEYFANPESTLESAATAGIMTAGGKLAEPVLGFGFSALGHMLGKVNPTQARAVKEVMEQFESDPFNGNAREIIKAGERQGIFVTPGEATDLPVFHGLEGKASVNLQLRKQARQAKLEGNVKSFLDGLPGEIGPEARTKVATGLKSAIKTMNDDFRKTYDPVRNKAFATKVSPEAQATIQMLMQADHGVKNAFIMFNQAKQSIASKAAQGKPLNRLELAIADDIAEATPGTIGEYQIIKKIMDFELAETTGVGGSANKIAAAKWAKAKELYLEILDTASPDYKHSREIYTRWGFDPESITAKDGIVGAIADLDLSTAQGIQKFERLLFNPDNIAIFNKVKSAVATTPEGKAMVSSAVKNHLDQVMHPTKGSTQDPFKRLYNKYLSNENARDQFKELLKGLGDDKVMSQTIDDFGLLFENITKPAPSVDPVVTDVFTFINSLGAKERQAIITEMLTTTKWSEQFKQLHKIDNKKQRVLELAKLIYQGAIRIPMGDL